MSKTDHRTFPTPNYFAWLEEVKEGQAGPDIDAITLSTTGATIEVSISSARSFAVARELAAAGFTVVVLNGDRLVDFMAAHGDLLEAAPECEGHAAGPFDPMGETVYCDGSCRAVRS